MDKSCLMALERTLPLFRDPETLAQKHPTYRMLATPAEELQDRAQTLAVAIQEAAPGVEARIVQGVGYLGSGSLPMEKLPAFLVALQCEKFQASDLARRLREDEACIFTRIEQEQVLLDVRTLTEEQIPLIAAAVQRINK